MTRRRSALIALAILGGAIAIAFLMISLRPDPPVRPPPSNVPFVNTGVAEAAEGAIPVHGAGRSGLARRSMLPLRSGAR